MIKIKAYFKNEIVEDETEDIELLNDLIEILKRYEKDFEKCEITYADGSVETLINSDYVAK